MSARSVKIAAAQYAPLHGQPDANLATAIDLVAKASLAGVALLVLPECCLTGYRFTDAAALAPLAEERTGERISRLAEAVSRSGMTVVAGLAERDGTKLYDSAVVLQPDAAPVYYRKMHLWGAEREIFAAGDMPVVVPTLVGRIGLSVCYDLWFPELSRALVLGGAEIIASPANWAGNPRMRNVLDEHGQAMGFHLARTSACVNEVVVVAADRIGEEETTRYLGNSCIVSATGEVVAGPVPSDQTAMIIADAQLGGGDGLQSHFKSRRPDVYARYLGETE
jgi:predicted amidohydrolase